MTRGKGAEVVILVRDIGDGTSRISVRTTGGVDATRIAGEFDGGGHVRRAGCTVHADSVTALGQILGAVERRPWRSTAAG